MAYGAIIGQKPSIDLSPYATKSELNNYALKTDLNSYATTASLNNYVKKTDMPSYVLSPQLIVNTLAGATVTAKSGSKTVTGTANSSGVCTLNLNAYGTWNVSDTKMSKNISVTAVQQYQVTLTRMLAQLSVGTGPSNTVKIKENGVLKSFVIAAHNYEQGLNGANRTLLVREAGVNYDFNTIAFNTSGADTYANSTLDNWFNNTYKNYLDSDIRSAIGTTKFYYTPGGGNYTRTTLSRSVFALSVTELGLSNEYANVEGSVLQYADRLASVAINQWTRTPGKWGTSTPRAFYVEAYGALYATNTDAKFSPRPVFTLNSMTSGVTDDYVLVVL